MPPRLIRLLSDGSFQTLAPVRPGRGRDDGPLLAIAPAEDVLLLEVPRPPGQDAQLRRAVPYAIEDQLAVPVETQHVAWAPLAGRPGTLGVAVVARARMQAWLDTLRANGLEPDAMVVEGLLPAWTGSAPSILIDGHRAVARLGPCRAFAGTRAEVEPLVQGDVAQSTLPEDPREQAAMLAAAIEAMDPAVDLLQGEFAPVRRRAGLLRAWAVAAVVGMLAVVLGIAHVAVEQAQWSSRVDAQRAEMADLYRELVPGAADVPNPEAYLASALRASGRGEVPVLGLFDALGTALRAEDCCRLVSLDYRNRVLEAAVEGPDVAALDALRARIAAAGARVELASATPGSRGIEARLRLGGDTP